MPFTRDEYNVLGVSSPKLEILLDTMLYQAKNEDELDWIHEQITSATDAMYEEVLESINEDERHA